MSNHGYLTSKRNFHKDQVLKDLQEINDRRFKGMLNIEDSDCGSKGSWFIGYQDEGWEHPEGFNIWICSPKKLEHRHSRAWSYYLEIAFANELGIKYNAIISDDGVDETWKPDPEKYKTFKSWLEIRFGRLKSAKPDSYKILFDLEMEFCPKGFEEL